MAKPAITWYAEYDASLLGLADGALVEAWPDAGGVASRDMVSEIVDDRPTFVASSVLNNASAVSFNGTTNKLFRFPTDWGSVAQSYTIVLVAQIAQRAAIQAPVSSTIEDGVAGVVVAMNIAASNNATIPNRIGIWAGAMLRSGETVGAPQMVVIRLNSGGSHIRVNGAQVTANAGGRSMQGFAIGQKFELGSWLEPTEMVVSYCAIKSGDLTAQELIDFEAWADTTYLTAAPAGDPPQGVVTVGGVVPYETSAVVTYSYNDTDQTGFEYRLNAGAATALGASPATITGLTASAAYDLEVRAINADGAGAWSSVTAFTTSAAVVYADEYNVIANSDFGGPPRGAFYKDGYFFVGTVNQPEFHQQRVSRLVGGAWTHTIVEWLPGAADVHNNPSVIVGADNHVYTTYCHHGITTGINFRRSVTQYDIDFAAAVTISTSGLPAYYPQLIELGARLYLFASLGPNRDVQYCHSDDGATWSSWTMLFDGDEGERPYAMFQEVDGEIAALITRTNPQDVSTGQNPAYFVRFDGTTWRDAGGTAYTLPITTATAQVMFNASAASASAGFFSGVAKDATGRWFSVVSGLTKAGAVLDTYLCRFDGTWSQTAIAGAVWANYTPVLRNSTDYEFVTTADVSGVVQLVRVTSADSGTTWSVEQLTGGSLSRTRNGLRNVFGLNPPEYFVYADRTRSSNTTWTSDIYQTFSTTTIPNTRIRYQLKSNGTPVASESGIKYALFNGTDPTTWAQIGSGTLTSDATGYIAIDTDTTPPGSARYVVLTKNDGTNLNGSGAQGPVITEVVA